MTFEKSPSITSLLGMATVAALLSAPAAFSKSNFETEILFRKKAWAVEITHDTSDGGLWCAASTKNRQGQAFSLVAYDTGALALIILDGAWNIPQRSVKFLIDVDYSRWNIEGTGKGSGVSLNVGAADKGAQFIRELMAGNAVAILNNRERRLAVFSLSGSSAAITKLMACWSRITNNDPFSTPQRRSNPF